jgi:DNA primase
MKRGDEAARLKALAGDARAVCTALGLLRGKRGRDWQYQPRGVVIRCPNHAERTPSCSVRTGRDGTLTAHCMGCRWSANVFGLVAILERLDVHRDFPRILGRVASIVGVSPEDLMSSGYEPPPVPPPPPTLDVRTFDAIAQIIAARCPLKGDVASYLRSRGLHEAALAHGWCALPTNRRALSTLRDVIVATVGLDAWTISGLSRDGGGWTWPLHGLVIPWRTRAGLVTTIQRRRVPGPRDDARTPKYVFPSGRQPSTLYGVDRMQLGPSTTLAFVEGAMDALAFEVLAARNGLDACVLGVAGVDGWQPEFALTAAGRSVLVASDNDQGGEKAWDVWGASLRRHAADVRRARPAAPAKDWSEVLERSAAGRSGTHG